MVLRSCSQGFSASIGVQGESSGHALKDSQNGVTFFDGIHLRPFSMETQGKPLPQVVDTGSLVRERKPDKLSQELFRGVLRRLREIIKAMLQLVF